MADASKPGTAPALTAPAPQEPGRPARAGLVAPLLAALLVAISCMTVPRAVVTREDDNAWTAALGYAHQMGLQFGTDVVYTHGPAGFLITQRFFAPTAGVVLAVNAALCLLISAGLCLLAWRLRVFWRCLLLGLFAVMAANLDPRFDFLFETGLLCWGLLCLVESGRRLAVCAASFTVLAVFGALSKVTFMFMGALSVGVIVCDLGLRGQRRLGLGMAAGFGAALVLGWLATGQHLANVWAFLVNAANVSRGYEQAMAMEGLATLRWRGATAVLLAFGMVALRTLTAFEAENGNGRVQAPPPERRAPALREPGRDTAQRRRSTLRWRRGLLWAWVTALLFIIWKHGFVMVERRHVVFFFGFVLMLTPALEVLPCIPRAARSWARGLGATACLLILATLQSLFFPDNLSPLIRPFSSFRDNLRTLLKPTEYARLMQQRQAAELAHFQVPRLRQMIGGASVDVFGQFQSYALFNGMNYRPRPVLQSFVAYNRPLMRLNEQFYASKAAPEYVLFDLAPILYRFPPLEDGWALRGLLLNYEPLAMEDSFLLLKARAAQAPKLTLLGEGIVRQGEPIDLRPYGDADIWMEIYVEPTWAGRLRQFFFQPARTRLAAWRTPRKDRIIKSLAPAPMLAAGFLASPLVLNNEDVLDLYTGNAVTRPGAYSVELTPEQRRFWQDTVRYRLYRIENRLGRCAPADLAWRLRYPGFGSAPAEVIAPLKQVVTIGGQPALELPRGGSLRFTIPPGAKAVSGSFALGREVYADGAAGNGVEFRLEEESGNGAVQLLHAETLQPSANPADQALRPFTAALTGEGERKLILKAVTSPAGEPASVPVCWGGIRFVME